MRSPGAHYSCQVLKKKIFAQGIAVIKHRKVKWVGFIVVNEMEGGVKCIAEFRILRKLTCIGNKRGEVWLN
jgi:hypothetical protein